MNLIIYIIYAEITDMAWSVKRRLVIMLTSALYKCIVKKFFKSKFRYCFLKDP